MLTGCIPHNKRSINGYHRTSNGLVPAKTEVQRMRNGQKRSSNVRETDIYRTRVTRLCCITYSLFSLLKTSVYIPAKRSFRVVYCFQPVRHSIIPWFRQWTIPSTFKGFFWFVRFCSNFHHTITIGQCMFGDKIGTDGQYYKSYATL